MLANEVKQKINGIIVGQENTPVLCIDNALPNIDDFLAHTKNKVEFSTPSNIYYPGLCATLPKAYVVKILSIAFTEIVSLYNIDPGRKIQLTLARYAYVSTPQSALTPLQCIPHYDNIQKDSFAILHYLNAGDFGGTGFFCHRPSGFERICQRRVERYTRMRDDFFTRHGAPHQAYIAGNTDHFSLTRSIEYVQNRLIVYPSNLLHSGLIHPDRDIHTAANDSRLTANIFLHIL